MQRTSKSIERFLFILLTLSTIALIILLVRAGFALWLVILVPVWLAALIFSYYFWFRFANPEMRLSNVFPFWANSIRSLWGNSFPVLIIKAGALQSDYFLLKKKPRVGVLYISPDSAAAVQTGDGQLSILQPGFHSLKSGEEIRLCFHLGYQRLTFGPLEDENPFNQKKSGESFTNFHARQLRAQKVKSYTKDARGVYPSFQIAYQLVAAPLTKGSPDEDRLLAVSQYLSKMGKSGNAAPILEEFIGKRLIDLWCAGLAEFDADSLFREHALNHILTAINNNISIAGNANIDKDLQSPASQTNLTADRLRIPFLRVYLNQVWVQPVNRRQPEGAMK